MHALPQSLLPLVWDFGTLSSAPYSEDGGIVTTGDAESKYIAKMIREFVSTKYNIVTFQSMTSEFPCTIMQAYAFVGT